MDVRRATPDDAAVLTDVAFRSKAFWGYDVAFMEACRAELTITAALLKQQPGFVAEGQPGMVNGFCLLAHGVPTAALEYLYVRPEAMGEGVGRTLFERAAAHAASLGSLWMVWDADPHAVPFYQRMGASIVGESPSGSIPGRMLPRMRIELAWTPHIDGLSRPHVSEVGRCEAE